MERLVLPFGCYFSPKDRDLMLYLEAKIKNQWLPFNPIIDFDIYSTEPWNLPALARSNFINNGGVEEEDVEYQYFFVQQRRKRVAGNGYWKRNCSEKAITNHDGAVIGLMRTYVYFIHKSNVNEPKSYRNGSKTKWIMHEYTFPSPRNTSEIPQWTICKIGATGRTTTFVDYTTTAAAARARDEMGLINNADGHHDLNSPPIHDQKIFDPSTPALPAVVDDPDQSTLTLGEWIDILDQQEPEFKTLSQVPEDKHIYDPHQLQHQGQYLISSNCNQDILRPAFVKLGESSFAHQHNNKRRSEEDWLDKDFQSCI